MALKAREMPVESAAYFEERMDSLLAEGLCERFDQDHVLLVEWADRLPQWWPSDRLELRLTVIPEGRRLHLYGCGPQALERLESALGSWKSAEIPEPGGG